MVMAIDLLVELLFKALKLSYHLCDGVSTNKYGRIDEHEAHAQESFYELTAWYLACNLAQDRRLKNNNCGMAALSRTGRCAAEGRWRTSFLPRAGIQPKWRG